MSREVVRVYEVLGEDTNKAATIGSIRLNTRPDKKIILSIDSTRGETLASAILTLVQVSELVFKLEATWMNIIRKIEDDEEE